MNKGGDKEDQDRESGCVQRRTEVTGVPPGLATSDLCQGNFCGKRRGRELHGNEGTREEKKAKVRRRMKRPQRGALTRPGEFPRLESGAGVAKGAFPDRVLDAA